MLHWTFHSLSWSCLLPRQFQITMLTVSWKVFFKTLAKQWYLRSSLCFYFRDQNVHFWFWFEYLSLFGNAITAKSQLHNLWKSEVSRHFQNKCRPEGMEDLEPHDLRLGCWDLTQLMLFSRHLAGRSLGHCKHSLERKQAWLHFLSHRCSATALLSW